MTKKKINPFDTAYEQYRILAERTQSTIDIQEKNLTFRRRINLIGVMQFLLTEPKLSNQIFFPRDISSLDRPEKVVHVVGRTA